MLQRVINENLYNKKANIPVIEEQEVVNNYDDIQKTKGFQQIKKIVESYGYELLDASIDMFKNKKYITIDIRGDIFKQPEIIYKRQENEFKILSGGNGGFKNIKETIMFRDNLNKAIELCQKLSKMDLINILPIYEKLG